MQIARKGSSVRVQARRAAAARSALYVVPCLHLALLQLRTLDKTKRVCPPPTLHTVDSVH